MTHSRRQWTVYLGLLVATLLVAALSLAPGPQQNSPAFVAIAAVVAVGKARFIVLDFMALRGTRMQRAFDAWLLLIGTLSAALLLR